MFFLVSVTAAAAFVATALVKRSNTTTRNVATINNGQIDKNDAGEATAFDVVDNYIQGTIEESRNLQLKIHLSGGGLLANDSESLALEVAVIDGFNQASGGCDDDYHRWM